MWQGQLTVTLILAPNANEYDSKTFHTHSHRFVIKESHSIVNVNKLKL